MHWRILAIGKPKLDFARAGIEEYERRIRPFAPLQIEYLKHSEREAESALLQQRSEGFMRVVLDDLKVLIEPSSAVPVAAALAGRMGAPGARVGIVLSGGNVDLGLCPFLRGDRPAT